MNWMASTSSSGTILTNPGNGWLADYVNQNSINPVRVGSWGGRGNFGPL